MPSFAHEAPLVLIRERPELVATLVREVLGVEIPAFASARVIDADFGQLAPTEFRADLVLRFDDERAPVLGVVVELQRARDERKRFSWPMYAAALHARLRCAVCLLVVTDSDAVATWARKPIRTLQIGSPFSPLVIGPRQIPRTPAHKDISALPELAVLSALAHGDDPGEVNALIHAMEQVARLPDERATLYIDMILAALSDATRRVLEEEMQQRGYEYQSEFARRYFSEGREEGREEGKEEGKEEAARAALVALTGRRLGGEIPVSVSERIAECRDLEALTGWIVEVGCASDAAAVLAVFE